MIPLPSLMRHWREREYERHLTPKFARSNLVLWAWFARRPGAYRLATRLGAAMMGLLGRRRGSFRWLPFSSGWTSGRDLPAPEGETFFARYAKEQRAKHQSL
jgi:L-lactate dehydrogenase complex protein LldF